MATNQGFKNFVCKDNLDPEFWYYYLEEVVPSFMSYASGNTFKEVSKKDVENTVVRIPPLSEQRRIAAILSTVDRVIVGKERLLEAKKTRKRALMQKLLNPGTNGNSAFSRVGAGGTRNEGRIRWAKQGQQDALGWTWKRLGDIGQITTGKTPDTSSPANFGANIPFITPGDFSDGPFIKETDRSLSMEGAKISRVLPSGSIFTVCIGATVGKTGISRVPSACNQQINALNVNPEFDCMFCFYALSHHFNKKKSRLVGAETLPLVNKTDFSNFRIPLPPFAMQHRIAAILAAADREIDGLAHEIDAWKEKRKALLQLLLSGKVRV